MATQNDSAHISYIDQYNKTTTIATKKYINKVIALFEKQVQCPFQDLTPSQVEQCLEQYFSYSAIIKETNSEKYRSLIYYMNSMRQYLDWLSSSGYVPNAVCNQHPLQDIYFRTKMLRDGNATKKPVIGNKLVFQSDEDYRHSMFFSEQEFKDFCFAVFPNDTYIHLAASLVLLWIGFSRNEIENMTRKDFHDKTENSPAYIQYNGHSISITDADFLRTIKLAIVSDTCNGLYKSPRNDGTYTPTVLRYCDDETDYILRRVVKARSNIKSDRAENKAKNGTRLEYLHTFSRNMKPHQERLPSDSPFRSKTLTPETIMLSGIFYRLKKENLPPEEAKAIADSYVSTCNKRLCTINYYRWCEISDQ